MAFLSVDIATIVTLLLIAFRSTTVEPRRVESWLIAFLCFASICHVALSRVEYGYWIAEPYRISVASTAPVLGVIRNMTPGAFALLTSMLFVDRRRQPIWVFGLLAAQFVLELLRVGSFRFADEFSAWLQIACVTIAVYWTVGYWREDLIEARRRARAIVSIVLALVVVAPIVTLRLIIAQDSIANYRGHQVLSLLTLAVVVMLLLRAMDGELVAAATTEVLTADERPKQAAEETRKSEDGLALKRLNALLFEQLVYRETRLTLKALADRVGLPEYRMRRLINEQLGFRNFNSFLHAYRVKDAAAQLLDPVLRAKSILAIAESVGYESVNTFNRGFKEVMRLTPSEFREQQPTRLTKN